MTRSPGNGAGAPMHRAARSLSLRIRDLHVVPCAPFLPRRSVIADPRVAKQLEHHVGVGRAVAAGAVGDGLLIGRYPGVPVDLRQLLDRAEGTVRVEVVDPFEM